MLSESGAEPSTFRTWWFFESAVFVNGCPRCVAFAFCGRDVLRKFAVSLQRLDFHDASVCFVQQAECDCFLSGEFSELFS